MPESVEIAAGHDGSNRLNERSLRRRSGWCILAGLAMVLLGLYVAGWFLTGTVCRTAPPTPGSRSVAFGRKPPDKNSSPDWPPRRPLSSDFPPRGDVRAEARDLRLGHRHRPNGDIRATFHGSPSKLARPTSP